MNSRALRLLALLGVLTFLVQGGSQPVVAEPKPRAASASIRPPETAGAKTVYEQLVGDASPATPPAVQSLGQWGFKEVYSYDLAEYWCENHVAVADFDRDGLTDIAILATTTYHAEPPWHHVSKAILLHNEGNWQFSDSILVQYPEGHYGYRLEAADLNNDGWSDLVVGEFANTHVFLNNQSGQFYEVWAGDGDWGGTDLADMNNDTFADILLGMQDRNGNGARMELYRNDASGMSFDKTWESELYGGSGTWGDLYRIHSANLDNDGNPDIAAQTIQVDPDFLITFSGDGTGTSFVERTRVNLGDRTFSLAVGNINGDTLTDLAVYVGWGQVRTFLTGSNASTIEYWSSPNLGQGAINLALTDFDRDGYSDLFVGTFGDGALRIYRNRPGNGFELVWQGALGGYGYTGTPADLDGDGYPDLIVGEQNAYGRSTIRILHNQAGSGPTVSYDVYLPFVRQ